MLEDLTRAEYEFLLRHDFTTFAGRCFQDLNPQTDLAMNRHLEVIAAKLTEVREGKIRRLIFNLPPRHLKSLMASIAFPAWCLGLDPTAQILCVSYAQDLADKLARDCRGIMMSLWYRHIFRTRLAPHRPSRKLSVCDVRRARGPYRARSPRSPWFAQDSPMEGRDRTPDPTCPKRD
jgi:hypothetical protein